jgi:tetratricopeptide (TPR) repeat protein
MCKCFGAQISGSIYFYLGKFNDCSSHLENALSLWDPTDRAFAPTAEDPYVGAMCHLSRTLLCLGHLDQSRLRREQALAEAKRLSPFMRSFALRQAWYRDWASEGAQRARTMLASAQEVVAISDEHGFRDSLAIGHIMRGWCLSALGHTGEGIALLIKGLTVCRGGDRKLMIPFFLTTLAEVCGMAGQPREGLDHLADAAKLVQMTHECWTEPEIYRLRGTLLLSINERAEAQQSYRRAIQVAHQQGAKFWELRAALDLARFWHDEGNLADARDLLSPIYGWFTEGLDTRDLKDAKALLIELA